MKCKGIYYENQFNALIGDKINMQNFPEDINIRSKLTWTNFMSKTFNF